METNGNRLEEENETEKGLLHHLRDELEITGRIEVARRHFAMEVFDGVLPVLGILVAGLITVSVHNPSVVFESTLLASIGISVAHFMGGFGASYLTETAEGSRIVEEFDRGERKRLSHAISLSHSIVVRAEKHTTALVAFINGATPSLSVLITISPMFLGLSGLLEYTTSLYLSILAGFVLLAGLGTYLGRISRQGIAAFTVKTILAGLLTMLVMVIVTLSAGV